MTHIGEIILMLIFFPAILWIGFWASILDIKTGKVRNSLIKKGYVFGITVNSLLITSSIMFVYVFNHTGIEHIRFVYFLDLLVNLASAFVVGFVFWKFDVWAAADSKIFILFSFLIPLTIYRYNKVPYFPSFTFLFNIFIIYIIFWFISFLFHLKIKNFDAEKVKSKLKLWKKNFNVHTVIVDAVIFYSIFLMGFSLQVIQMPFSDYFPIMFYAISFILIRPLNKLLKKKTALLFVLAGIEIGYTAYAIIFSDSFSIYSFGNQIMRFSSFMIIVLAVFKFLNIATRFERKMVRTENISANMVLTQSSFVRVRDKRELTENLGTIYPDGLLENQSESLKKFLKKENITEIEIFKTFPFIPFIFASAIITIIIGDSISHWIVGMMRNIHF